MKKKNKTRKKDETSPPALFTLGSIGKNLKEKLDALCGVALGVLGPYECRFAIPPKEEEHSFFQLVFTALTGERKKEKFHFVVQMVIF